MNMHINLNNPGLLNCCSIVISFLSNFKIGIRMMVQSKQYSSTPVKLIACSLHPNWPYKSFVSINIEKKALISIHNSDMAPAPKRILGLERCRINQHVKYINGMYANMNLIIIHLWVNKKVPWRLELQYIAPLSF